MPSAHLSIYALNMAQGYGPPMIGVCSHSNPIMLSIEFNPFKTSRKNPLYGARRQKTRTFEMSSATTPINFECCSAERIEHWS